MIVCKFKKKIILRVYYSKKTDGFSWLKNFQHFVVFFFIFLKQVSVGVLRIIGDKHFALQKGKNAETGGDPNRQIIMMILAIAVLTSLVLNRSSKMSTALINRRTFLFNHEILSPLVPSSPSGSTA